MENPFATLLVRTAPVLSSEPVDSTDTAASIDVKNGSENNSALGNSNIINVSSGSRTPLKSQTPGKISRNSCAASTPTNRGSESSGAAHTPSKMSRFSCTISTPTNRGSESSTSVRKLSTTGKLNAPSVSWQQSPARSVPRSAGKGCDVATPGKRMAKGAAAVPSSYGQSKASPSYTNSPGLSPRSGGAGQGPSRQTPSASTSAPPSPMPFAALIFSSSLATAASPEPMVNHQPMCRTLDAALRQSLGVPDEHISSLPQDALLDRKERMRQSLLRIRSSVTAEELEDVPEGDTVFDELRKLADATCVTQPEDATVASQQEEKEDAANKPRRESMVLDQALVRQMLPRKVCLPLREGKPVPPEAFSDVAIFFSDVVGFTTISAGVPPIQVLQLLNTLFTVMDYCCSLFPLYKVETIGDAYMVAGGLPERDAQSAENLADFAILVQAAVAAAVVSPLDGTPIQIRMGCHTGNVMAGVVGTLMPRYCLFGDTVNTASRMESNGEPGRVHCSEAFAAKLAAGGKHILQERGVIDVKGKGPMRTHWLVRSENVSDERVADVSAHCVQLATNSQRFEDSSAWE